MRKDQLSKLRQSLPLKRVRQYKVWKQFVAAMLRANIEGSRIRRWARIRALISDGFMPEDYFEYRMFLDEMFEMRETYLTPRQLIPILRREQNRELELIFDSKSKFHDWCISHQIPTVQNIGLITNKRPVVLQNIEDSFFVKPVDGICGRGAVRVTSQGDLWEWPGRPPMKWPQVKSHLISHQRRYGDLLVQNCLQNHTVIRGLTGDILATVRVVTIQQDTGEPEILLAALRCSTTSLSVDNFAQGGLVVGIDELSGQLLGKAAAKHFSSSPWLDYHPITGASLKGLIVPDWPSVKALAVEAHRSCKNFSQPTVGWDIALCPNGPLVIEANAIWDPSVVQLSHQRGLLTTKYGSYLSSKYPQRTDSLK